MAQWNPQTIVIRMRSRQCHRDLIARAYPALSDGKTLLPFKRFFMVCLKK